MMPPLPFVDAIVLLRSFPRVSRPAFAARLQGGEEAQAAFRRRSEASQPK
jgi:hypothetical protein